MLQSVEGKTLHNLKENMSQTSVGVNKEQTIKMKDHIPRQTSMPGDNESNDTSIRAWCTMTPTASLAEDVFL